MKRHVLASASVLAAMLLAVVAGTSTTLATWNDTEWAHGTAGTVDCAQPSGQAASRGVGRELSGFALGTDLDTVAALHGVTVTSNGTRSWAQPANQEVTAASDYAAADPLNLSLLGAQLNLSSLLMIPLNTPAGVIGQYGQARPDGTSAGAAGLITSGGAINVSGAADYPHLATISLSGLLNSVGLSLGTLVSGVTDARVEVGAVAGRASIDGCDELWTAATSLVREYLVASLTTVLESPTVGAITSTLNTTISTLETTVNTLASQSGLLSAITAGVNLIPGFGLASVTLSGSATINTAPARALLLGELTDPGGVVKIVLSPADGGPAEIRVNTAALLAKAYPGGYSNGLNGLAPNFNPLSDPAVVTTLNTTITEVLQAWVGNVQAALLAAIEAVGLNLVVSVTLLGLTTTIAVTGTVATPSLVVTPPLGLAAGLVTALTDGIGGIVAGAVRTLLTGVVSTGIGTISTLVAPVAVAVSAAYNALFISGLIEVTVNAQNRPGAGQRMGPWEWDGFPAGMYSVAALRVAVLNVASGIGARLHLGRGTVGPSCSMASAPTQCAGY